jgi:uncharacterized protein (TIGR03118 family)
MSHVKAIAALLSCSAGVVGFARVALAGFSETNLVSDGFVPAPNIDPQLINPWGISFPPGGPFWVADNNSGFSTLYNGSGVKQSLVVTVPPPGGSPAGTSATPTGNVFNSTTDFQVGASKALFIFSTEDGTISGWNSGTAAVLKVDNSAGGAVYKGLALGSNASGNFLYATNFNSGKVDVFDKNFAPATLSGTFTDPNLPAGFAPFGIQDLNGKLFVSYALQDAAKHDDVAGLGNGFVDVFDTNGNLLQRLISGGQLDSPWGMTIAPASFGQFGNDLLVGNFENSRINAYDPATGTFEGTLQDNLGNDLSLTDVTGAKGLWDLTFGGGGSGGAANTLFFSSGINAEQDGLLGSIQATAAVPLPNAAYTGFISLAALTLIAGARRRYRALRI